MKKIHKFISSHTFDYLVIGVILAVFFICVLLFQFSPITIKATTFFAAMGYFLWGVTHHTKAGHIDKKILLEYLGIAFLSIVIVFSLIN